MANDGKNEKPRFSRSGRVLKKTLKMKEMEEVELEENIGRQFPASSSKISNDHSMAHHSGHKVSMGSNSSGSSRTLSPYASSGYERGSVNREADRDSTYFQMEDDNSSTDSAENGSSDLSSSCEANETPKSQKFNLKTNAGRRKCSKKPSKRKITKFFRSVTRKGDNSSKVKRRSSHSRKTSRARRKAGKDLATFNRELLRKPVGSLRTSSNVLAEKGKESKQFPRDRFETVSDFDDESEPSAASNSNNGILEPAMEHPLGIGPIDVAAHLKLLGDNLRKIGLAVAQQNVTAPGVGYVLLVSLLCAVGPLLCLTREIAGLRGINDDVFVRMLDHIAYIMPGL